MKKKYDAVASDERGQVYPIQVRMNLNGCLPRLEGEELVFEVPMYQFSRAEADQLRELLAPDADERMQHLILEEAISVAQKWHRMDWIRQRMDDR